jgi:peptide/nickel transport system substrate-binding protein
MKKFWTVILVLIVVGGLILSACAAPAPGTEQPAAPGTGKPAAPTMEKKYGGTLKIITNSGLSQIGYAPTVSGAMTFFVNPCMEGLLWQNALTGEFTPMLAASFEQDPNGKFITLKLRPGIKFHDGTDCNAQAVKSYLELKKVDLPGWLSAVASIDIIDQNTIKLNTTTIDLLLYGQLAEDISSPTHLAKGKDAVQYQPVGTGPFKFADYKRDSYLKYARFDGYWGGKPYLDGVEYIFVPDEMTVIAAFLAGEANVIHSVNQKDASELKAKGYTIATQWSLHWGLAPDSSNTDSPYAKKQVREAIDYAIDKESIAKSLGYGLMQSMDLAVPSQMRGYTPNIGRRYNPEKAKQLLSEAGYPNGFETTISIRPGTTKDALVAAQSQLAKVGITAKLDSPDMGRYTSLEKTGWKNTLFHIQMMYGEPIEYYLERTWSKARKDYVSTARPAGFDDMINKLVAETNPKKSDPLLKDLVKMMNDEAMYSPLVIIGQSSAVAPDIHDFGIRKTNSVRFERLHETWIGK